MNFLIRELPLPIHELLEELNFRFLTNTTFSNWCTKEQFERIVKTFGYKTAWVVDEYWPIHATYLSSRLNELRVKYGDIRLAPAVPNSRYPDLHKERDYFSIWVPKG